MKAGRIIAVAALGLLTLGASQGEAAPDPGAAGCADVGDTGAAVDGFPGRMSTLLGSDISTGGHDCFERVVLEFEGGGELPGYSVSYEPDPILDSPSGEPVDIAGDATLVLSVGAWMTDIEGNGYDGPSQIIPTNVVNILELRLIENNEGQHQWAIGLDRQRDFRVSTLTEPTRIVIDIALDLAAPPASTEPPASSAPAVTTTPPPASTSAPATNAPETPTTEAPPDPQGGTPGSTEDHPLVGTWLLIDAADPDSPPFLGAFSADGIYQQADYDGLSGYGAWESTGPSSAALTFVQLFSDGEGVFGGSATIRATIEVDPDGQLLTGAYTLELGGVEGAPTGEYGPGAVTGTRLGVEPTGTPVGELDELFAEFDEGTDGAGPPSTSAPTDG